VQPQLYAPGQPQRHRAVQPQRRRTRSNTAPTQASIYVRISLDKTGEGLGVERQEQECRRFCAERGWEVREVFCDNDISATTGRRRPGFEALLASDPEVIVVWHTDRLVRLSRDLERVIDLECNVHGVTAGHIDLSNPAGRAVAKTITAWAQYEGEQKAERQRAAGRQRAARGRAWWGSRPFGFETDGSHRNAEARRYVRRMPGFSPGRRSPASLATSTPPVTSPPSGSRGGRRRCARSC
jgi:site-specific DNA recombinase